MIYKENYKFTISDLTKCKQWIKHKTRPNVLITFKTEQVRFFPSSSKHNWESTNVQVWSRQKTNQSSHWTNTADIYSIMSTLNVTITVSLNPTQAIKFKQDRTGTCPQKVIFSFIVPLSLWSWILINVPETCLTVKSLANIIMQISKDFASTPSEKELTLKLLQCQNTCIISLTYVKVTKSSLGMIVHVMSIHTKSEHWRSTWQDNSTSTFIPQKPTTKINLSYNKQERGKVFVERKKHEVLPFSCITCYLVVWCLLH